ncbi:MAG: EAL domain-containing protein [Lachnospiraceae bacterium]|nr:EAL domain-containing protein [Lachnospiraceae bacterium]
MDFQKLVDNLSTMCCVVSVEVFPEGRYGKFRIVTGNKPYIASIETPMSEIDMNYKTFVPNSEYTDYLGRDLNFEDACYRAAYKKQCIHSYVRPDRAEIYFNMMFIPLESDREDLAYCLYIMEIDFEAKSENMSNISSDVAASVLDTCIRLRGSGDFKATMKEVLVGIRELCDAEHCCILLADEYNRSCEVLGEAFAPGTKLLPMEEYLNDDFYDIVESWPATIAGSNCIIAKNDQDMEVVRERNPVWYESLTSAGAYNIVLFPLKSGNQLLGYIWALNYDPERAGKIKETLDITTFIVGSELGNHLLLDRLGTLSSKDLLTGVMNRNEMNNVVDSLCHGEEKDNTSIGVIFTDVNGLKAVNDLEGHNAGDRLLKNAANALREVFDEKDIFRAGGDEFAIILSGIREDELDDKIARIRSACEKYGNVVFAIGGAYEEDSRNVRVALRRADENMYEDKRIFYEQNPERIDASRLGCSNEDELDEKFRERSIFREMNYDHLTGLPSMTYFFKLAEIGRKSMHERDIPSALVYINLSRLRYYNKRYGFAEGDELIKDIAAKLAEIFGEENCSRFGQDHFALFTESEGLENRLNRLFKEAKRANGGKSLFIRAGIYMDSMGLVETSLACDRAKYAGNIRKDDSCSTFNYYDSSMLKNEINRQYIVDNLDRAINENWIKAFYQPIVRSTNRLVCDEEALARWIDPEKGMLSPADFIPILEDTRLIYKLDLHVVDIILERMKMQKARGYNVTPVSVNLSRTDFESCDIVEEINYRVETAGMPKDLLTIEITESVVGENFEFMKEQVERFQDLGFKVWMDDFGSGYSSLDLLQEMQFDLIKFDMRFMRQFESTPKSRVILTELMRMAQSLGMETVCEGVESSEQADFLSEIGCTKMQGYYFCKPIPVEEIWDRIEKGTGAGFENPDETEYYRTVGSLNMYDLSSVAQEENVTARHHFSSLPMAIVEYDTETVKVIRCSKSYREFMERYFSVKTTSIAASVKNLKTGIGKEFADALERCRKEEHRVLIEEKTADGSGIQAMIKKVADNPVRGISAYTIAVLDITEGSEERLSYANVAQALSSDYLYLYYVNLDTDSFIEYSSDGSRGISLERHGKDFFAASSRDAVKAIYEADREAFISDFTKENITKSIDEHGAYINTYRLLINDVPTYVNMKAVHMNTDNSHIIIGVSNVDAQMRQQEAIERLKEEQITYSRISALIGEFIAIYSVDPESGNYIRYSSTREYSDLQTSSAGNDFYSDSVRDSKNVIHPDDYERLVKELTKEKILSKTQNGGIFKLRYRLMLNGEAVPIILRAGIVPEKDGPQLIVGVCRYYEEA